MFVLKVLGAVIFILLLFIAGWVYTKWQSSLTIEQLRDYVQKTIALEDGTTAHYRDAGDPSNPTLLLIHGGMDNLYAWDIWTKELSERYRVISVDLPGHGLTDPAPKRDYGRWLFAEFIDKFTRTLDLKDFTIVGNSYGGETAIRYVVDTPGRAKALVLIDSGGFLGGDGSVEDGAPTFERMVKLASSVPGVNYILDHILLAILGQQSNYNHVNTYFTDDHNTRFNRISRYEKNRGTIRELAMHGAKTYRDIEGLEKINIPTLILWGELDGTLPVKLAHRFDKAIPESQLIIYPGIGHMPQMENPKKSAADLDAFIQKRVMSPSQ